MDLQGIPLSLHRYSGMSSKALSVDSKKNQQRSQYLQKADGNADRVPSASQSTLIVCNRPRITRELFNDVRQLPFATLDRHQKACSTEVLRNGCAWPRDSAILRTEAEHVLDLLR